jgi:hypothetical protein
MRFQRADHDVLKAKAMWILVRSNQRDSFTAGNSQYQSAFLNSSKMIAARDDAHLMPDRRQLNREIAAYSTSAKDAKFHTGRR